MKSGLALALVLILIGSAARAETAPEFRKKKRHHPASAAKAAAKPDPRDEEIRLLRQQVDALTGSQQALLNRLSDIEGKIAGDAKREGEDIAIVKAAVQKDADEKKKAVEGFEKKWGPSGKPGIKPYGFLRMDAQHDAGRLNDRQNPFFVQPINVGGVKPGEHEYDITPRLSRIGFDVAGSEAAFLHGHPKVGGKLELDFVNGGASESREAVRIRHAYASLDWANVSVLAGQFWDVIAPMTPSVNPFTLLWNAGNLGDRRPQLRTTFEPDRDKPGPHGQWTFTTALLLTGAVDIKDLDGNGRPDGEESGQPMWQGRVGWSAKKPKDPLSDPFTIGLWGMHARELPTTPFAGHVSFEPGCIGIDMLIPIVRRLALRTELWNGHDLSDVRGGIGQGVNALGGEVGAKGGWVELTYNPRGRYWASAGFSRDHPRFSDLAGTTATVGAAAGANRSDNRVIYQTNHFRFGGGLELWLDYSNWKTEFTNTPNQTANRFELALQQNF